MFHHKGQVQIFRLNALNANTQQVGKLDYLIVSGYQHMSFYSTLTSLHEAFNHHPSRIIVLTEQPLTPLIIHFFSQYCRRFDFVPLGLSYAKIFKGVKRALFSHTAPQIQCTPIYCLLSAQESRVLKRLFSGMRVSTVCMELRLSDKTISAHKQHALAKLQCTPRDIFHHSLLSTALLEPHI